jgi:ADP-ribosylglycohydrolase
MTHSDPAAEHGALAVALAARYAATRDLVCIRFGDFLPHLRQHLGDVPLLQILEQMGPHLERGDDPAVYAAALGLHRGVSGYVNHTVPVALYCWLRSPGDFRGAVEAAVLLGGDADTTGAIVGALMGATMGSRGVPAEWVAGLAEWPRTVQWMRTLGSHLARQRLQGADEGQLALFWPGLLLRNVLFLGVVLLHVLRRCLPPY